MRKWQHKGERKEYGTVRMQIRGADIWIHFAFDVKENS